MLSFVRDSVPPARFDDLDLNRNQLGPAGAHLVAAWPALAGARWINLENNQMTDRGLFDLAASPHLGDVQELRVAGNLISKSGKDALKKRFGRRVRVT